MFLVVINRENTLDNLVVVTSDQEKAREAFFRTCSAGIRCWSEYTEEDKVNLLVKGYENLDGGRTVVLIDTDGISSNAQISAELDGSPPPNVQRITRWLESGEIDEPGTIDEVLNNAGDCLDGANSSDICGPVTFQAEDGNWYCGSVEFIIRKADPEYIKGTLEDVGEDDKRPSLRFLRELDLRDKG